MEDFKHTYRFLRPYLVLILLAFLLQSCGSSPKFDYDPSTDFAAYKTYNWFPSLDSGLNEFDNKRVMRATDSILQSKGLVKSEFPDLLINFYANEVIVPPNQFGIGIGTGGGNVAVGGSTSVPIGGNKLEQTFTMDFVDPAKDELLWQGVWVKKYFESSTPEQKKEHYKKVILNLLSGYPPK